jgi:SPP1 family holin
MMPKVTAQAVTRLAVLVLGLLNAVLEMSGIKVLPISNDELSAAISAVWLIGSALWSWWKDNPITRQSVGRHVE